MAVILVKKDTLDEINPNFVQAPLTQPVFLNSVPKCGTHLIKNTVRMFVPVPQHWNKTFIQIPNLKPNLAAFSTEKPMLSWGHLLFNDDSALALRKVRHLVLIRDPYDWVLARTRFYLSREFQGPLNHIKNGAASVEDVMNMMILGVFQKAPSLLDIFTFNGAAWMGTPAKVVRYEDLIRAVKNLDTDEAEAFFRDLLDMCGVVMPGDWRERVRIGSDRRQSGTARENLHGSDAVEVPDTLPAAQRKLVDFHAPGLRRLLGYE
jgi:hypothetical protein